MPENSTPGFEDIESAWFVIRERFGDLYRAAPSEDAQDRLIGDRDGARDAYYLALGKSFDQGDAFVKNTQAALKAAQADLKDALADLRDVVAALALVGSVAQLMAALAAMGA